MGSVPPGLVVPTCSLVTPLPPSHLQAEQHQLLGQSPWVAGEIPEGFVPRWVACLTWQLGWKERRRFHAAGTICIPTVQAEPNTGLCDTNERKAHMCSPALHTTSSLFLYSKQDFVKPFCWVTCANMSSASKRTQNMLCIVSFLSCCFCHCCYESPHLTLIWGHFLVLIPSVLLCTGLSDPY